MSFYQAANDVRTTQRPGQPGDWARHGSFDKWETAINASPQAKQVSTITVSGPTNSELYTVTIDGVNVEYQADGSATTAEVVAGLVAAIEAEPRVRGAVVPVATSSTVVTLTGTIPGVAFTLAESEGDLAIATSTAAASAEAIPPGRCLMDLGYVSGSSERKCALAKSSLFTAQVQTITVTYVASNLLVCQVYEVRGSEEILIGTGTTVAATDRDTTLDALITAINADLPADSVLVTADNATATALVFTAEVAGLEFRATIQRIGGGASAPTITSANTTGPSRSTSFHRAFLGISLYPQDTEVATIGSETPTWPANNGVRFAKHGHIFVESDESITSGDTVYVELGVTADNGQLYNSDSATRIAVARSLLVWERDGATSTDSIAAVRVSVP